jgi:hypothetical protein
LRSSTWIKLYDDFLEHPKVEAAGEDAALLYVGGLLYCSRALSDGFIPATRVKKLTGKSGVRKLTDRLVDAGLWEPVDGGYQVHNYTSRQRTAEQVEADRAAAAERQRRAREAKKKNGDSKGSNGSSHGVTGGVSHGKSSVAKREREREKEGTDVPPSAGGQAILPHGLSGFLVPVADVLRRVAERKPGAATPTDAAVAKTLQDFPNKDLLLEAQEFEHYWLHGLGAGKQMKDVVATFRNRLRSRPDVLRKTPPSAAASPSPVVVDDTAERLRKAME